MKILFVVSELGHIDPLSVASLSAVAKKRGHKTFFCSLDRNMLMGAIYHSHPDVVAFNIDSCSIDDVGKEFMEMKQ